MLTLSTAFTNAFEDSEVEPVYLVDIFTATTAPLMFCTGSKRIQFIALDDNFFGEADVAREATPSVAEISALNIEIDPFERNLQTANLTVSLHDDAKLRDFLQTTRLINQMVQIKLGTADMTDEDDWAPVFNGMIVSVGVRSEGVIDLECKDYMVQTQKMYFGNWINKHPLEVLKKLLEDQGVPEEFIDDDSFDLTEAQYADIRHFVLTHWNDLDLQGTEVIPDWNSEGFYYPTQNINLLSPSGSVNTTGMLQEIARSMMGSVFCQETGVFKFVRFDVSKAASVHWTDDDIGEFEQLDPIYINELTIKNTGSWNSHAPTSERLLSKGSFEGMVRVRDATAQTNYSFPGESKAIFPRAVDFDLQGFVGKLKNPVGGGSVTVKIDSPFGLCGSRTTGNYLPGPTNWGTLQATGVGISADRPLYILIDSEVMKSEEVDLVEGVTELYLSEFTGNETPAEFITADNVVQKPGRMNVTVTSGNRGMLDTTEASHAVESSQETELPIGHVMDMTIAVTFAETTLQRFSNGCHMIELTTSLAQWAIQVGDVVTLDNDQFLAYGFDGLTSATKWEVVGKELSLNDSDAYIRWRLAFATKTSPPSIVVDWDWLPKYLHPIDFYSNNSFWWGGVGPHVTNGLDIETDSGLNVTLNAGLAAGTGIPHEATIPLSASKDHYVSFNARTNGVYVESVTTGGDDPGLLSTAVPLAKVVAGASSVSSIDDRRTFGVISPTAFSAEEHEAGANLVWNPNFESWTRGSGYEPDHWTLGGVSPTWATDWVKSESPHRGKYAVKSVTASTSKLLYSSHFPVEPGRSYQVGISVKPSSGSITVTARVEGLDSAKAYSAAYNIVSASSLSTSDWTTKTITYTAASGEHYARVRLGRSANAGTVLFDTLRFVRAMPSFFATNATQTVGKECTDTIAFTTEAYDHGSNYNAAAATFTAPFDGVYQFSAQVIEVTNDDSDSYISFFKNGSLFLRSIWGNGHQINSGPIALASGDTIIPKFYNDYNGTATITGAATKCWFSGAQIQ